jgi:hypothetical protein
LPEGRPRNTGLAGDQRTTDDVRIGRLSTVDTIGLVDPRDGIVVHLPVGRERLKRRRRRGGANAMTPPVTATRTG